MCARPQGKRGTADDDNLYTAYGDGYGFDPIVPNKLGLGFARVIGGPTDFTGENIRSDAENTGMGTFGKKASGMLMVDGVLYIWARNADNNGHYCQLAWSRDYAQTWTWSNWNFKQFGYLTFVNFGVNYTGVPDQHKDYVYMVSQEKWKMILKKQGGCRFEACRGIAFRLPLYITLKNGM